MEYFYDDDQNYVNPEDYDENGYYIGALPGQAGFQTGSIGM